MERRLALALICLAAGAAHAQEAVRFAGPDIELAGRLYRPEGPGPFAAIVMLHGCSGLWTRQGTQPTANYRWWAQHFRSRGYVALLVDSFGPRGEREICTQKVRRISEERDRPADAYAALRWLAARHDVDSNRIHLMGWSNGAMAALHALRADAPGREPDGAQFRSGVVFYPGCNAFARAGYRPTAPLLIQAGAADDWTPARHCETLAARAKAAGSGVSIDVYPGAHHGFDAPSGTVHTRPDVRNPSAPTGWGATVGPNPPARARAIERVTEFLGER